MSISGLRERDRVRAGITDSAQDELGEVVYIDLPVTGTTVEQGRSFGEIESTKTISDLHAPVGGRVVERNNRLDTEPALVNTELGHHDRDASRTKSTKGVGTVSLGSHGGRGLLAAAVLGTGVTFFDGDALTVALPAIADDLEVGISSLQWLLNLFVLVLGAFLLVGGSLGDRIGRRPVFFTGLAVLASGTLLAAVAPELWMLFAARVLQGAGAALLVPVSLAVVSTTFTDDDRSAAIGWWSGLTATSSVIGPVAGGFLTTVSSWRSIYFLARCLGRRSA